MQMDFVLLIDEHNQEKEEKLVTKKNHKSREYFKLKTKSYFTSCVAYPFTSNCICPKRSRNL
jgi:hypothetical protein